MQYDDDNGKVAESVDVEGILRQNETEQSHTPPNELDYDAILESIGFGRIQWLLLLISGLMTITSIAAQQSMGIVLIASQCEFATTQADKGIMMAACVAGIFLSTYFWGYISDAVGRRTVLLYGIFASSALQFLLMFVTNIWVFNVINLAVGISLGGVSASLYAYLSEFNIPRHRAVVINYSTMFVSVAAIYIPAAAWLVLSANWSVEFFGGFVFRPWRLIMLINLLPGLIGGLLILPYPESPKLLLAQNKIAQAVDAVAWISQWNTGKSISRILKTDYFTLKPEVALEENIFNNRKGCGFLIDIGRATLPLFHKPHGCHFVICILAVFGMFFSSNGMQYWFPEIVNRSADDAGSAKSQTVCEILDNSFEKAMLDPAHNQTELCVDTVSSKTYIETMIVGVAFLIGFIIQGALLNPLGRKTVLLTALLLSTLSGVLLHFMANTTLVLILFCLYILLPGLSISIMIGAVVDLVPTHLRGKAVSFTMTFGRLGIILAANLMGVMLEPFCNTTFAIFTITMFVCVWLVHYLPIKNSV